MTSFRDLGVPKRINEVLYRNGITEPFPIQTETIRASLAGNDLCGRAPTGSGKTLAFAVPLVENTIKAQPHHPRGLVLVPTRELANQVRATILPLAQARGRWVAAFYGGTNIRRDIDRLQRGVDIAVATPGRLADLVQRGACSLSDVDVVVIDEADRMADMGFLPEVKRLLDQTSPNRQTLLFSATLDGDIDVLVRRYQRNPVRVEIETPAEERGQVNHLFWPTDRHQRAAVAAEVVRRVGPAIVFTRTKHGADRLAKQLANQGLKTAAIHGNRSQSQREAALARFAAGEVSALVATDVAARGIHVDGVPVVLHYDLPGTDKDYVHRSGRTGRAGARGVVVSLVCEDQHHDLTAMQRALGIAEGMHEVEYAHLHADVVPDPHPVARPRGERPGSHGKRPSNRGQRPSGQRTSKSNKRRQGNGGGGRQRAQSSRSR